MPKRNFSKRKDAIRQLIQTHPIQDQQELIELLARDYNMTTNQAAISRDLRDLGIFKRKQDDRMVYTLPEADLMLQIMRYALISVEHNETVIVIKTVPGTAGVVADYLDTQDDLNILGTIAGENTIFVMLRTNSTMEHDVNRLCQRLNVKETI